MTYEMGDTMCESARFSRTRPGNNQQRARYDLGGLSLVTVKSGQDIRGQCYRRVVRSRGRNVGSMGLFRVHPFRLWAVHCTHISRRIYLLGPEWELLFEQRRTARFLAQLFLPEQPDCSVYAVIASVADHFLFA